MIWRSSHINSACVSLIHGAGLNSIDVFRTEAYDHMGPVGEDPRWIVLGHSTIVYRKSFPRVRVLTGCLFDNGYQINLGVGRPYLQVAVILFREGGIPPPPPFSTAVACVEPKSKNLPNLGSR